MAKKGDSTSTTLEAHSQAKVELFGTYLATYLNILQRAKHINHLKFFDLCAGEGVYADGGKGSPVVIMEKIKDHYFTNKKQCLPIEVFLNDPGMSKVEPGRKKIDRVKEAVDKLFRPNSVTAHFTSQNYTEILEHAKAHVSGLKSNGRAIVFIDPWGYKDIKPEDLTQLMQNGRTEVLLFMPTADMHRFADKSLNDEDFPGGRPLRKLLQALFGSASPDSSTSLVFAESLLKQFRQLAGIKFADKFTLERGTNRFFCLYFFTSNILGLEKMIEAKWKMDEQQGRGFKLKSSAPGLFDSFQFTTDYPEVLEAELRNRGGMTNQDLKSFGLLSGFLPKHTRELLKQWKDKGILQVEPLDGLPVNDFYIPSKDRRVSIKLK
ncbi:MAG: three-Cys-motif partner protein TcmP [Flavobacteriales bacterium]|nr:three-Cys-motif partner protein TcmP [Flavobacteriales bacterium]